MPRRPASPTLKKSIIGSYIRNFVFGVEDSLVSTVGMVSGIAVAGTPRETIILSGIVLIIVEAFSMGVGTILSEQSEEEYLTHKASHFKTPITNGVIMFTSYFIAGFIPMTPYLIDMGDATIWYSMFASVAALGVLGAVNGIFFKISIFQNALKMAVLGGMAIAVGILVGQLLSTL